MSNKLKTLQTEKADVRVLNFRYFLYLYLAGITEGSIGKYGSVWHIYSNSFPSAIIVWLCKKKTHLNENFITDNNNFDKGIKHIYVFD